MRDTLECVFKRMRKVIHRIYAPLVARAVVSSSQHSVYDGIAHVDIGTCHIDLRAQHLGAVGILALFHLFKKSEILFNASISPRTFFARLGQRASRSLYLLCRIVADVCQSLFDKQHSAVIHSVKIVRRIQLFVPLKAQPLDILFDRVDVLDVLFAGIGVVIAQITLAVVFFFHTEIYAKRFGVTDMQISVWFRRKTRDDFFYLAVR